MGENVNLSIAQTELICKPPTPPQMGDYREKTMVRTFLMEHHFLCHFQLFCCCFFCKWFVSILQYAPKDLAFLWLEAILDNTKVAIYYGIHFKQWLVQLLHKGRAMVGHTYVFPYQHWKCTRPVW